MSHLTLSRRSYLRGRSLQSVHAGRPVYGTTANGGERLPDEAKWWSRTRCRLTVFNAPVPKAQRLRPPKGRTWGRRGCTLVGVTAAISPRVSLAALLATKPGHRPADLPHPPRPARRPAQGVHRGRLRRPARRRPPAAGWAHCAGLGQLEHPHQQGHGRADRAVEDPAQAHAVPPRTAGRLPRQHWARVRTIPVILITPPIKDC